MTEQVLEDLGALGVIFAGYVVMALLIVLVMRRWGPVWASSASNASLLALTLTFVISPGRTGNSLVETAPAAVLTQCAVVVITTGLGSRLSRLPDAGPVRRATIAPRRLFVARVPHQRLAALASAGIAFAAMGAASLMATNGDTLVRRHNGASGVAPGFPGWPTLAPSVCAGLVLAVSMWWALREIQDRPRIVEPTDTLLRARDASRVVRAAAFGFALTGCIVLSSIGSNMNEATQLLRGFSETAPRSPWDFYQWAAFALYVPAAALLFVAIGAVGGSVGSREELEGIDAPTNAARVDAGAQRRSAGAKVNP